MGFNIVKKNCLFKNDENLKIGHISLTNEQSFEINNEKDLEMIERHKLYKWLSWYSQLINIGFRRK